MDVGELSYQDICNPAVVEDYMNNASELRGTVILNLSDGRIRCSIRQAIINLLVWRLLYKQNIPICKRHFIKRQPLSRERLGSVLNNYYNEISLGGYDLKAFQEELYAIYERLYGFTTDQLQRYTATMDIIRLAKLMNEPKMKKVIDTRFETKAEMGTAAIEKHTSVNSKKIIKMLSAEPGSEEGLQESLLHSYQVLGLLNKFQVPQVMYQYAVRTDVDDTIIGLPVIGNATSGLRNAAEYAAESLSAKKPSFYNHGAIKRAQYFGRTQHIVASTIEKLYDGDCGSTATVRYAITEDNYVNTFGKYVVTDKGLIALDHRNIKDFIGKTVYMRSAMTCRHVDGICQVCAGKLAANLSKHLNIGITAAIQMVSGATQKILSAKHLINTMSILYSLPADTSKVLHYLSSDTLAWNPAVKNIEQCTIGIPLEYFARFDTIPSLRKDSVIAVETMSNIVDFAIRGPDEKVEHYPAISEDGNVPFLSREMLMHIRDTYKECTQDEEHIWVPLRGTKNMPILKTTVVNDNMLLYVNNITAFFSGPIRKFNTCSEALEKLSALVHSKVTVNITWLDILLKAYLITGGYDLRIPVVKDSDNVKFENTSTIITNRTVGGELAYEKHKEYLTKPQTYLVPKQQSMFDVFTVGNKITE